MFRKPMVLPEGSTLFHQEASERYFTIFVCLLICGSLALNNSPERNVFYQVRALQGASEGSLEGATERALEGDFEATSGKNKENVKPVQQRQEIERTEPRKSWIAKLKKPLLPIFFIFKISLEVIWSIVRSYFHFLINYFSCQR